MPGCKTWICRERGCYAEVIMDLSETIVDVTSRPQDPDLEKLEELRFSNRPKNVALSV